jgi:RNA polymerase sigma factor (sigma-70 family)
MCFSSTIWLKAEKFVADGGEILEREIAEKLITDAAKTIFSYCRTRTDSREEAEDLSQDIILELLRTRENLRDDKAFYGFMWAVAGNVYKSWCKKRRKINTCALDESLSDDSIPLSERLEKESDYKLLHRELGLLTGQYRQVVILYYFNDCKVSDISKSLNISESMVKFLLFKSRKILKEGMNMERTKGDLSFNPVKLSVGILIPKDDYAATEYNHAISNLVNGNLLAQNILFACYNDRLTAEEISLQIGAAVPYLEKDLESLCEKGLLVKKGGKYETDIVLWTKEFMEESAEKTLPVHREIAAIVDQFLNEHRSDIKALGFQTGTPDDNLLKWHITHILLNEAGTKYAGSLDFVYPTKYAGTKAIVFGTEYYPGNNGWMANIEKYNANGDKITVHDFTINNTRDCPYLNRHPNRVNILLDIAGGKTAGFSENDLCEIADFIKLGFIRKTGEQMSLSIPVFTKEHYKRIKTLMAEAIDAVVAKMREAVHIATDILVQHAPVSMKKDAENIGWIEARVCGFMTVKIMLDNGMLQRVAENAHPTAYVVLA